jgi:hypothetical protein
MGGLTFDFPHSISEMHLYIRAPAVTRDTDDLKPEQRPAFDAAIHNARQYADWVAGGRTAEERPAPLYRLVHGGPGAGKSFIIKTIMAATAAAAVTVESVLMAPMALAANLIGGMTLHSAVAVAWGQSSDNRRRKFGPDTLRRLRQMHNSTDLWALVVDEISAVSPYLFSELDHAFRQIMGVPDVPFGGLSVFLFGDFFQLPPPRASPLYDVVVRRYVLGDTKRMKSFDLNAAELMLLFTKVELVENERAKDDPAQAATVRALRDATPGARPIRDHLLPLLDAMVLTNSEVGSARQLCAVRLRVLRAHACLLLLTNISISRANAPVCFSVTHGVSGYNRWIAILHGCGLQRWCWTTISE